MGARLSVHDSHFLDVLLDVDDALPEPKHQVFHSGMSHSLRQNGTALNVSTPVPIPLMGLVERVVKPSVTATTAATNATSSAAAAAVPVRGAGLVGIAPLHSKSPLAKPSDEAACIPLYLQCDGPIPAVIRQGIARAAGVYHRFNASSLLLEERRSDGTRDGERLRELLHYTANLLDQSTCNMNTQPTPHVVAAVAMSRVAIKAVIEETALLVCQETKEQKAKSSPTRTPVEDNTLECHNAAALRLRRAFQKAFWLPPLNNTEGNLQGQGSAAFTPTHSATPTASSNQTYDQRHGASESYFCDISPVVPKLISNACDFIIRCPITTFTAHTHIEVLKLLVVLCSCGLYAPPSPSSPTSRKKAQTKKVSSNNNKSGHFDDAESDFIISDDDSDEDNGGKHHSSVSQRGSRSPSQNYCQNQSEKTPQPPPVSVDIFIEMLLTSETSAGLVLELIRRASLYRVIISGSSSVSGGVDIPLTAVQPLPSDADAVRFDLNATRNKASEVSALHPPSAAAAAESGEGSKASAAVIAPSSSQPAPPSSSAAEPPKVGGGGGGWFGGWFGGGGNSNNTPATPTTAHGTEANAPSQTVGAPSTAVASASQSIAHRSPPSLPLGQCKQFSSRSVLFDVSLQLLCLLLFYRRGFDDGKGAAAIPKGASAQSLSALSTRNTSPSAAAGGGDGPNASKAIAAAHASSAQYAYDRANAFASNTARDIVRSLINTRTPTTSSSTAPSTTYGGAGMSSSPFVNRGGGGGANGTTTNSAFADDEPVNPLAISFSQLTASLSAAACEHPYALGVLYVLLMDNPTYLKIMLTKYSDVSETMVIAVLQSLVQSSDLVVERAAVLGGGRREGGVGDGGKSAIGGKPAVDDTQKKKVVAGGGWLGWLSAGGIGGGQPSSPYANNANGQPSPYANSPSSTNAPAPIVIGGVNNANAHAQQSILIPATVAAASAKYRHSAMGSALGLGAASDAALVIEAFNSATSLSVCYSFHLAASIIMILSQDMCVGNALFGPWKLAGQKIFSTPISTKQWSWLSGTVSCCGTLWLSAICRCLLRAVAHHYSEAATMLIASLQNVGPFIHNMDTAAAQRTTRLLSAAIRRMAREAGELSIAEKRNADKAEGRREFRKAVMRRLTQEALHDNTNNNPTTGDGAEGRGVYYYPAELRLEPLRARRAMVKALSDIVEGLADTIAGAISITDKKNYALFYELLYHKPQLELGGGGGDGSKGGGGGGGSHSASTSSSVVASSSTSSPASVFAEGVDYLKRLDADALAAACHEDQTDADGATGTIDDIVNLNPHDTDEYESEVSFAAEDDDNGCLPHVLPSTADYPSPVTVSSPSPASHNHCETPHHQHRHAHDPDKSVTVFSLISEALRPIRTIAAMVDSELASVSVNHTPEAILGLIRTVVASHAALLERGSQQQQQNAFSGSTTTSASTALANGSSSTPSHAHIGSLSYDTQSQSSVTSTSLSTSRALPASNCLDLVFTYRESPSSGAFFTPMLWASIASSGRIGLGVWDEDPASLPLLKEAKQVYTRRVASL